MPKPTVRVRIAFVDGPYVASPTWTDVTSYVRAVNTSRGRTDDWQDFDSGSATVVLDNRDRRFDPTYTAGPYYGNLQPRRQIYIDATTDSGSTYKAIFRGYIDGWPVNLTAAGFDSTVTINCYDVLGLISQNTAPYDWADAYIRALNPVRYIKFDDVVNTTNPSSSTFTDYGSANLPLTYRTGANVAANMDSIAIGLPYRALNTAKNTYFSSASPVNGVTAVSGTAWAQLTFASGNQYFEALPIYFSSNNSSSQNVLTRLSYYWNVTNSRYELWGEVTIVSGTPTTWTAVAPVTLDPTQGHHFGITVTNLTGTPTIRIYVDGSEITNTTTSASAGASTYDLVNVTGKIQQLVIIGRQLTAAEINDIFNLSIGQITETTAARFTRALGQTSVPAALYSTAASPAGTVAKINNGGEPIRNTIQYAGDSEGGEIYVTKAGVLTMTNRTWYQGATAATSQATFGSGGIPIGTDMTYSWTANGMRNALNMTWSGDTTVNVTDATSIAAYGTKQDNYETQLSTASDTSALGTILVGFGKFPRLVMSAIELNMALSLANWATVLDLELLQRITVAVPEKVGSTLTQTQIIQQIEHQITPGTWTTSILGSSRWSSVFILNSSVLDGTDLLG